MTAAVRITVCVPGADEADVYMNGPNEPSVHQRWAHLRFSVIGQLLAAPPPRGELRAELKRLCARTWQHPITGKPVRFALSTIERWLTQARRERGDPVAVLRRKVRADAGTQQVRLAVPPPCQCEVRHLPGANLEYKGSVSPC